MLRSSCTMLLFIVLLQLFSVLRADYSVKCVNDSISKLAFEPSKDGVSGRYDVEWCRSVNANVRQWNLVLSYNLAVKQATCSNRTQPYHKHSELLMPFERETDNCSHMCFYTTLDMVFNGCFILENWLPDMGSQRTFLGRYVNDSIPRQSYMENIINADVLVHDGEVTVHWFLDKVVASTYDMRLCENRTDAAGERKIIQNQVFVALRREDRCEQINDKCNIQGRKQNEIICSLGHINGSYYIELTNLAPWKGCSVFSKQVYTHYSFNVTDVPVRWSPPGVTSPLAWACGAVLVLCAVAAAAGLAWRVKVNRRFQERVHQQWTSADKPGMEPVVVEPDDSARVVLLLYAREGELGEPLIRALRELLEQSNLEVIDLYSAEVVSRSATAPGAWVRAMLQRGDTRVLLLQTPALAAIYGDRTLPLEPGADAALLHRRTQVVQAEPSPSDALLSLALRLLAEDVHTPTPYNKYYLATLESLETDTLPHAVPFRRYTLPADATTLILDMRPADPPAILRSPLDAPLPPAPGPPAALHTLRHHVLEFVQHVQRRPGYLHDHLLLLD